MANTQFIITRSIAFSMIGGFALWGALLGLLV